MSTNVLIVDDIEPVRSVLRRKFEECGYVVHEAEDGRAAMRELDSTSIDVVVTDVVMPDKDGLEVVIDVRQRWPGIPIIVISAPGNRLFLDTACRLGAVRAFEKPLDLERLVQAVDDLSFS